jgi:uncharacterized membrane protein YidH (DUF202 family)
MNAAKIAGLVLIVLGALGLAYGGLTYTRDHQEMRVGSMSLSVSEHRTVPIPLWAGVAAVVLGAGLLLVPAKKG